MNSPSRPRKKGTFGSAQKAALSHLAKDDRLWSGAGIPLGWYADDLMQRPGPRLAYRGNQHLVTVAPTRSGKGATAIIPTLLEYGASTIVIDPKGQNAAVTARHRATPIAEGGLGHDVYFINPFDLNVDKAPHLKGTSFNPLDGLDPADKNFVANVNALCEALIQSEGTEPHWANSARDLIAGLIMYLVYDPEETPSLGRLREILTERDKPRGHDDPKHNEFRSFIKDEVLTCGFPPAIQKAGRFQRDSEEIQSVLSTALTQTAFLDDPAIAASLETDLKRPFSFVELKQRPITVYLILPGPLIDAYAKWLRLFIVVALNQLMAKTLTVEEAKAKRPPVLLIIDEFASLGHLKSVETAMGIAAGYGIQLWPILQDLSQVKNLYKDRWETFFANAGIIQLFAPNDMTTAKWIEERCGMATVKIKTLSTQTSERSFSGTEGDTRTSGQSVAETGRPLMTAYDLVGLEKDKQTLLLSNLSDPIMAYRKFYKDVPELKGRYDSDPYHVQEEVDAQQPTPTKL